ncbi:MAG: hypothetical protein FJ398_07790 [Verrucomicrobia bacterium]|nr:hypothetical protein [Verrucomicrobiota bacterium]
MFTWLNKQGVKSSKGFILQGVHRFYYHYLEGQRCIQVDVEPCTEPDGTYSEIVYLDSLQRWQPPFDSEKLTQKRVSEIRQNISEALGFMGVKHSFK